MSSIVNNTTKCYITNDSNYDNIEETIIIKKKIKKNKKQKSIDTETKYIKNIRDTYWKIDDADKPLKVPSAYTIKELQEIAEKLGIILMNEKLI